MAKKLPEMSKQSERVERSAAGGRHHGNVFWKVNARLAHTTESYRKQDHTIHRLRQEKFSKLIIMKDP